VYFKNKKHIQKTDRLSSLPKGNDVRAAISQRCCHSAATSVKVTATLKKEHCNTLKSCTSLQCQCYCNVFNTLKELQCLKKTAGHCNSNKELLLQKSCSYKELYTFNVAATSAKELQQ